MSGENQTPENRNPEIEAQESKLSNIANELAARLGYWQSGRLEWEKIFNKRGVQVELDHSEKWRNLLPPPTDVIRKNNRVYIAQVFNEPTLYDLENDYSHIPTLNEENLTRLYIGLGISGFMVKELIRPNPEGIKEFYNSISSQPLLFDRLSEINFESSEDELNMRVAIAQRNPDQTARTNMLRFCMGVYLISEDDGITNGVAKIKESVGAALVDAFKESLKGSVDNRAAHIATLRALGVSGVDAEIMWAESLTDISLAGALPMRSEEIVDILRPIHIRAHHKRDS